MSIQFVDNETPVGVINGVNQVFTLSQIPNPTSSLYLFLNGVLQTNGVDYTLSGLTITYTTAPGLDLASAPHTAFFRYAPSSGVLTQAEMTGSDIKEFAESILDGVTIPEDFFYQLLNIAKNKLEEKRIWQYLKRVDSTNNGYTGGSYSLPDDFALDYKLLVGDAEYIPVSFEEQHTYKNVSNRYYIDWSTELYYLLGNVKPDTIYLFYKKTTDDITSSTSPIFPKRFHPLLGYYVAAYYQNGVEYDDIWSKMSPENKIAAMELENAMALWDQQLSARSQDHRIGVANSEPTVDLSMM